MLDTVVVSGTISRHGPGRTHRRCGPVPHAQPKLSWALAAPPLAGKKGSECSSKPCEGWLAQNYSVRRRRRVRQMFWQVWALLCKPPKVSLARMRRGRLGCSGSPQRPHAQLSSRAKVRTNRCRELGTGSLLQPFILEARGRGKSKSRGLEVQLSPSATQKPWQRMPLLAVPTQWPQEDGFLELVFAWPASWPCDPPADPSPSRAEDDGAGRRPGRRLVDSAVGRKAGRIMRVEAAWRAA